MLIQHLIDTALFDIDFDDEETAFEAQSELEGFCKRQLLGVVEQVFDRASQTGLVMRLPSLEIDLGSVAYQDYRDELPRRLRERLGQRLAEWRIDADGRTVAQGAVIERRQADWQLLEYFLLWGHLPWYAGPRDETALDGLSDRVLSAHAARLRGFLQTTPHRHRVIARLAGQFSNSSMARLFRLLVPSHAAGVGSLMETLALAWGVDKRISVALGLNQAAVLAQLWRFLIELVLEKDGRQESAWELMSRALRVMLIEWYGVDRSILTAFIEHSDPAYIGDLQTLFQPLMQRRGGVQHESTGGLSDGPKDETRRVRESQRVDADGVDVLQARLLRAILSGDPDPIESVWDQLLGEHRFLLERLLRRQGQRAEIRRRLAQGFKDAQLRDILQVLEPLEHGFVSQVINETGVFHSAQVGSGAARIGIRSMWEFSLGYLLVERGSRFNKKSYLGSLLRQMAAAENRAYRELLDVLLDNLASSGLHSGTGREMRQLLVELKQEQSNAGAEEDSEAFPEPQGSRLYCRLSQALGEARGIDADTQRGLQRVIDELQRAYPWQLLRLLRELQAGVIKASALPKVLSPTLLRQLVLAFVDLTIPEGSELRDALAVNERRAGDPAHYFRRLLNCLVRQRPIDFEELLGADIQEETAVTGIGLEAQENEVLAAGLTPNELSDAAFMQRLEGFLSGETQLTTGERQALIQGISHCFAHRSQDLVRLLPKPEVKQVERRIARLVSLLPEAALADLLADWLRPASLEMLHGADLITTACLGCPLGVPAVRLRRLKWEYLLGYLLESGPLLDEAGFLRGYVEHLSEHTGQADGSGFRAALGRQLLVDRLPSTHSRVQRIVVLLAEPPTGQTAADTTPEAYAAVEPDLEKDLQEIHVYNAGMVLAAPYLPSLFERLGLTEGSTFKDRRGQERAVHLLQYLVEARSAGPEYRLVINKLLCGLPLTEPIPFEIELGEQERQMLDGLLEGLLENWKALGQTSPEGLREAFLQREGRLEFRDDAWDLRIESRTYDMLLDQLPWGFSTIRYPWMEKPLYVEWE